MMTDDLNNRQRAFIAEYLKDMNGTQAAIRAGYSAKSAHVQASRLLSNDNIQRAIQDAMREHAMTPEEVAYRLSQQARASMADFLSDDDIVPRFDLRKAWDSGAVSQIKNITFDGKTGYLVNIELHDSQKALQQLARIHAMLTDRVKHTHSFEKELEAAGFNAGETFEQLVASLAESIETES